MAKLIKQIHDLITLATDKGLTTYHSDSQIDDAIDQAQMTLFRQLNERMKIDKSVANLLLPFELKASITITAKIGTVPTDFEHEIEVWSVDGNSVHQPIVIKQETFFRRRRRTTSDPIDTMSDRVNTGIIYYDSGKKIEIEQQVTPVYMRYYKRPVKPEYVTTLTNGQYVYDDSGSTDVEWSHTVHDIITEGSCNILGVNLRDLQVQRFGQKEEAKIVSL